MQLEWHPFVHRDWGMNVLDGWTMEDKLLQLQAKKNSGRLKIIYFKKWGNFTHLYPPKRKKEPKVTWTLGPQSDPYCSWPNVAFLARNVVLRMHRTSTLWPLAMDEVAKSHRCSCEHSNAKNIQKDPKSKEPIVVDQPKHQQKNINPNINRGCCYFPISTTCGSSTGPPNLRESAAWAARLSASCPGCRWPWRWSHGNLRKWFASEPRVFTMEYASL